MTVKICSTSEYDIDKGGIPIQYKDCLGMKEIDHIETAIEWLMERTKQPEYVVSKDETGTWTIEIYNDYRE